MNGGSGNGDDGMNGAGAGDGVRGAAPGRIGHGHG